MGVPYDVFSYSVQLQGLPNILKIICSVYHTLYKLEGVPYGLDYRVYYIFYILQGVQHTGSTRNCTDY